MNLMSFKVHHTKFKEISISENKVFLHPSTSKNLGTKDDDSLSFNFLDIDKITVKEKFLFIRLAEKKAQEIVPLFKLKLVNTEDSGRLVLALYDNSYLKSLQRKELAFFSVINHYSFYIFLYLLFTTFLYTIGSLYAENTETSYNTNVLAIKFHNIVHTHISDTVFYSFMMMLLLSVIIIMRKAYKNSKDLYLFKCCS
ncbi:hypothetical protein NBT05_15115 [Aquimarina sp. ERC-38]|uniref:hypothetical protein n=1 Tax=Aquimarina sp. ERC-38 TaxID=2949996 RepID=UPI002247D904|nr:hypothetical protein [Aquimarina sp. ERC-38]UZO80272.1 hypothetical protein NBT05_15115 [Aquimarina sp. ERC-38]